MPREWKDEDDLLELIKEKYYVKDSPKQDSQNPPPSLKKSLLMSVVDLYFYVFIFLIPGFIWLWPIIATSPLLIMIIAANVVFIVVLRMVSFRK